MLIGEYSTKLSEKKRIALPIKLRNELGKKLIITRGYDGCLIVLNPLLFEKLISNIQTKPFLNKSLRDTKRFVAGGAFEIDLDEQGRFVIQDSHIQYANIKQEITIVGIIDWVEIWDKDVWDKKVIDITNNSQEIADRLN
jgi:MraZ protein